MVEDAQLNEFRAHWRDVLFAAVGLASGVTLFFYVQSLFPPELQREFGWTRAQMSGAAIATLAVGIAMPLVGWLIDRVGVRIISVISFGVVAACYFLLSRMQGDLATFYALNCGLIAGGAGTLPIAFTRTLGARFKRARGLALGISMTGISVAAFFATPLLQQLIAESGWRAGYMALGIVALAAGLPAGLMMPSSRTAQPQVAKANGTGMGPWTTRAHVAAFAWLAAGMFAINLTGNAFLSQLALVMDSKGFPGEAAAWMISLYAASVAAGRLTGGAALDRFPAGLVASVFMVAPAVGLSLLLMPLPTVALPATAVVLIGASQGAETDYLSYVLARYFDIANYGALFGLAMLATTAAAFLGNLMFGFSYDWSGGYDIGLAVGVVSYAIGAVAFWRTQTLLGGALETVGRARMRKGG